MSYQQIQQLIEQLRERPTVALLRRIIKQFAQYTNLEEKLPPENLMTFCIFQIPAIWNKVLKIEQDLFLQEQPNLSMSLQLQQYLNTLLKLLTETTEDEIKYIILEGMGRAFHLTLVYKKIYKTWLKNLIDIWATNEMKVKLRAFSVINRFLGKLEEEECNWVLRRTYVNFVENAKHVTWRNFEYLNLMINCYTEFAKSNTNSAYYVMFGYLRMIVVQIEKALKESKTKKKELIKKLYSFEILNCFRLITAVITRVNSNELTALIYPLIQTLDAYSKLNLATEFIPLRLHIISLLIQITEKTGVFIPCIISLISDLLNCKDFTKKKPKTGKDGKCQLILIFQISENNIKNTTFWTELFQEIMKKIYWICSLYSKLVTGPEILATIIRILRFKYKMVKFAGYKMKLKALIAILKRDIEKIKEIRKKEKKLYPSSKNLIKKYETGNLQELELEILTNHQKYVKEDLVMLKQKLKAEFEGQIIDPEDHNQQQQQEGEQDAQQNLSGASQYQPSEPDEKSDSQNEVKEDISYEGDPDNIDEVIKQWSQHSWSSQQLEQGIQQ